MVGTARSSRTAFLIPTHKGSQTIAATVASALALADVYVVDDGSPDDTSGAARLAGAFVYTLNNNVGKANAIRAALDRQWVECDGLRLAERYEFIAILDDDVILDEEWLTHTEARMSNDTTAAVEGYSVSYWPRTLKWNGWVAARAMTTWRLQRLHTPLQIATGSKQWLIGAHVLYRASVLDRVARSDIAFAVEDMDYLWQIKRADLGTVEFERKACGLWQQATSIKDVYKQHLRWMHGYWQTIRFHRAGHGRTKHDRLFTVNLIDMAFHLAWPVVFALMLTFSIHREFLLFGLVGLYAVQGFGTALVLKRWQCMVLWPYLLALDLMYRILVIQGFVRAVRSPLSKGNWISPERTVAETNHATPPGLLTPTGRP